MLRAIYILMLALSLLIAVRTYAQKPFVRVDTQRGHTNWRNREGGGEAAVVDTVAMLADLLPRLNGNWRFVETGKAYWIGYTDDMYSIAAHGESAVDSLLAFIESSDSYKARIGAVYCLHLIGIKSTTVGRTYEQFHVKKAREALKSLLVEEDLQSTIISLLIRDPWQSDVPYFFQVLSSRLESNWAIVNAMARYHIPGLPMRGPMPYIEADKLSVPAYQYELAEEQGYAIAGSEQCLNVLQQIKAMRLPTVVVEDKVFGKPVWGSVIHMLSKGELTVEQFIEKLTEVDYFSIGSQVHYYISDGKLHLCSTTTAETRLITWWKSQSPDFYQQFAQDAAKGNSLK
jgi:hypothetical protein